MNDITVNKRRIRKTAPHRKSLSCTNEDLQIASELENLFNNKYPDESPFSFSKTISKALEIAYRETLKNNRSIQAKRDRENSHTTGRLSSKNGSLKNRMG